MMKQVKIVELEKGLPLSWHIYYSAGGINKANAKLSYPDRANNSDGVWMERKDGRNRQRVAARG